MNAEDLKKWIIDLTDDITFEYEGKRGAICPFSLTDISVGYDGEEFDYTSIDEAMNTKFINGFSLNEIADKLDID